MITANLKGGLGNLMFQIAAVCSLAKDNGVDVGFDNLMAQLGALNKDDHHNPSLNYAYEYLNIFKNLDLRKTSGAPITKTIQVPFKYIDLKFEDGACYDGFFQCERFFSHNKEHILNLFEPTDEIRNKIIEKYKWIFDLFTCAIHVRRGDYLKLQHVHAVQNISYFKQAIDAVGKVDRYLVFSDDVQWCKNNFKEDHFYFVEGQKDYMDLFLMSMCSHQITSNSSFSWWGGWLNKNLNKKVVGPLRWFNDSSISSNDILPESWIKIHA